MKRLILMLAASAVAAASPLAAPLAFAGDRAFAGDGPRWRRDDRRVERWRNDPGRWERRGPDRPRYERLPPDAYGPPAYARPRAMRPGGRLPPGYGADRIYDYDRYRLRPPPHGYAWYRVGDDLVLVSLVDGRIFDVID